MGGGADFRARKKNMVTETEEQGLRRNAWMKGKNIKGSSFCFLFSRFKEESYQTASLFLMCCVIFISSSSLQSSVPSLQQVAFVLVGLKRPEWLVVKGNAGFYLPHLGSVKSCISCGTWRKSSSPGKLLCGPLSSEQGQIDKLRASNTMVSI